MPGEPYNWDIDKQRFFSYLCFYNNFYEIPEEERPSDNIISDDIEIDRWWDAYTNPHLAKMKTKAKNNLGGKEVESFSF